MSMDMLLCNFTDQAIRNMKDVPSRRAAAREKLRNSAWRSKPPISH
jgi:uncharacterized protein with GYD domain